jgi:iron(III) transport system substrate-binding protein
MFTFKKLFVGAVLTLGAATAFARVGVAQDAQAEWKAVLDKAKGQELNLALQPDDGYIAVVSVFEKKFPQIKVQATRVHPSQMAPRIVTEQKNGLYAWDVWWATASNMNTVVLPVGGFEKITDYMILPEVKDTANWYDPKFLYTSDRGPYIFVHTHYLQTLGLYNTDLVPPGSFTLDTLLDPKLKGKISIRVPNRPHGGSMMLAAMGKDKGADYLKKLFTTMEPKFLDNDRLNTTSVINGENAVGIGTADEVYFECVKEGGCKNVKLLPTAFMHSRGVGVLKNAPHKDATKVFVNWLLSKDGQETFVREWAKTNSNGAFTMRKDVKGDPAHAGSMPDFNHLDKYVAVSLDSGAVDLQAVSKLYAETRK